MIELREIRLFEHLEFMESMFVDHWLALGSFPDLAPLKPDFGTIMALEDNDKLVCLGAFDGDASPLISARTGYISVRKTLMMLIWLPSGGLESSWGSARMIMMSWIAHQYLCFQNFRPT